ncbi:Hypothetical predicted protein, partial [Paramuricea clavata]
MGFNVSVFTVVNLYTCDYGTGRIEAKNKLTQLELSVKKTANILEKGKEEAIERHLSAFKVITSEVDQCKRTVEELKLADKTDLEAIAEFEASVDEKIEAADDEVMRIKQWLQGKEAERDAEERKIEITRFDGSPLDWPRFWGQFTETVDKCSIAPVNKFAYLCGFLSPKVKTIIEGLPFDPEGYSRAKAILQDRYGKNSEVIKAYIKIIFDLPTINQVNLKKIHQFNDQLMHAVQALQTLKKLETVNDSVIHDTTHHKPNLEPLRQFVKTHLPDNHHFTVPAMSAEYLLNAINNLSCNKAKGVDSINIHLLQVGCNEVLPSLLYIYNTSITSGIFPDQWKISKITPVFKKGSRQNKDNYRPIAVLSVLSKILERFYGLHLLGYLQEHNLLTSSQFGSRPFHSCETMLLQLTDSLLNDMDKGNLSGILLIDFRKAFDLISHDLLLQKLAIYDLLPVHTGVPQGSSLGPLLFILFINDIPLVNKECNSYIYVDDTTLVKSGTSINTVRSHLQTGADNLSNWASENRMAIHPNKTKVMLIGSRQKLSTINEPLNVSICGTTISQTTCEKLLGVHMDDSLTWNTHISHVIKKYNNKLELVKRAKPYLTPKLLLLLYNSIAKPTLEYCCSVWGNCSTDALGRVTSAQKRAARILLNADYTIPSITLFKEINLIPIHDTICHRILLQTFKCIHNISPPCLSTLMEKPTHHHSTRAIANNNVHIPKARSNAGKRRFSFIASTLWNNFPNEAKKITSQPSFNTYCKSYFSQKL